MGWKSWFCQFCSVWMNCTLHNFSILILWLFSVTQNAVAYIYVLYNNHWHKHLILCRRKVFRLLAVYCMEASQKLLEKQNLWFYMVQIVYSNAKILNLWRQEFLSRFSRCTICISFNFFCQGTVLSGGNCRRAANLNELYSSLKRQRKH